MTDRLERFLSRRGRVARMPEGIRVWGERAARTGGLDATLGVVADVPPGADAESGSWEIARVPAIREAYRAWDPPRVFPYAPVAGVPGFRDGWRRWIAGKAAGGDFARPDAWSERLTRPVATCGVSGALAAVGHLALDPEDTVLVPDSRWDGYDTTLGTVLGARLEPVRLLEGGRWDVGAWTAAMGRVAATAPRVVAILNFPHNPTGFVPTDGEYDAFADAVIEVAERTGSAVVVVCDDAYEGFVWAGDRPRWSIFYRLVDRHPGVLPIKCDGITKELLFWGGRLGAATAAFPGEWSVGERAAAAMRWESAMSAVVRGMVSSASTPVQTLVGRLLEDPDALAASRRPILDSLAERHAAMRAALETDAVRAVLRPDPFHGGLFAFLHLRRGSAVAAAERLLERRIGVVPFEDSSRDLNALRLTYATVPLPEIPGLVASTAEVVGSL